MAMSAEEEIQAMAQHYLVCGTEDCKRNCQFYCNPCHQRLCKRCRDEHQKSQDTKDHEVVPYKQRKPQLPEEKCNLHPKRNVEILCKECNVPLCAKCIFMKEHTGHQLDDLEEKYAEKVAFCRSEISKIQEYYLSTSQGLKKEIKEDVMAIKNTMDDIRNSIRAEAESLKELVDRVTSDKLEQANIMEESLLKTLKSQEKTYEDYTEYLEKLLKEFHSYKSIDNIRVLFSDDFENLKIQSIPETTQPVLPVFTAGHFYKDEVSKLLGSVNFPNIKPDNRRIKPMEKASTQLKLTGKQTRRDVEKSDVKPTLSLSSSVTKVREYTVPGVGSVYHISLGKSGRLWASDAIGNLVQTDLQGNQLQKIKTNGGDEGYHTVTQDGDLIYTDRKNKVINRIKQNNTITKFIKTGDWEPISIHSSHINGDILVGMRKGGEAKVTRYNKTGKEIQNIQRGNKGRELYSDPHYITENINGDICTSDFNNRAVVVVNKSGQHRFSYTGQGSGFNPFGICTDRLGHIIVCNGYPRNNAFDILDQDGQFLSLLLTLQQGIQPYGVCVDDENNLHVGQLYTTKVTVYKYLQ
ncbi:tripartite motif-containing protein 3-like [Crassostrea angulata]|uniref:tripartite motif-containing protein 3-like n=1 Tax=Magallana angulata TaxID=2784310 RepID=UPI0022B16FC4|nr:tripartite motif-containing protein 3-like [Crassostrea angulata]XP_052684905.1 tripartite motif-containing protein 3-like [Crassostrea angulata]